VISDDLHLKLIEAGFYGEQAKQSKIFVRMPNVAALLSPNSLRRFPTKSELVLVAFSFKSAQAWEIGGTHAI
jgi:hypothetical protein